jgi:hypothetical protein
MIHVPWIQSRQKILCHFFSILSLAVGPAKLAGALLPLPPKKKELG